MDILIKNIKIPKSCDGCFACEEFSYECYDYCNILKAPTTRGERRMDCPLVALPEHGRLGDLDRLKSKFDFYKAKGCWGIFSEEEIRKIKMVIDEEPTVLEASR